MQRHFAIMLVVVVGIAVGAMIAAAVERVSGLVVKAKSSALASQQSEHLQ